MNLQVNFEAVSELVRSTKPLIHNKEKAGNVQVKGRADFVTEVDYAIQKYLADALSKKYPEIEFLGEEGEESSQDWSKPVWILDPVDGTTNLIHDLHMSVVSLALWDGEALVYGCIYNPYRDEVCTAVKGQGTKLNGQAVRVSKIDTVDKGLYCFGSTPYRKHYADRIFPKLKRLFMTGLDIRRTACAAMDLYYVATGRIDAYFEYQLRPWDVAAGIILVEEAGGRVSGIGGKIQFPGDYVDIAVSNGKIHDVFLNLLNEEE